MSEHVGFIEFNGKFARFDSAKCRFADGELDVDAKSSKCRLRLYGVPFKAASVAELPGCVFGPTSEGVRGDPFAEGGVETKSMWLSWESLHVRCGSYDSVTNLLTVNFSGEVRDSETGRSGTIDGQVRSIVVDPEEFRASD